MSVVTLYTKPGCHLCEAVEQLIREAQHQFEFEFVLRNILDDAGDFERYQNDIPVVLMNGVEIARHRLEIAQLMDKLESSSNEPKEGNHE